MVHGSGFLWHQIRCIVAILILIGQGKEEVNLVKALLDIEKYPCTPNYQIASGEIISLSFFKKISMICLFLRIAACSI
jgi:tRNA pseudouridine38/39 synthase